MKSIKSLIALTLSFIPLLSCNPEQKVATIAKDYLVEQGNNITSITVNKGTVEGYYECITPTLGLIDGYLVNEIWDISLQKGKVVSAVKRASSDSTVLTNIDSGETIILNTFFQEQLPNWCYDIFNRDYEITPKLVFSLEHIGDTHFDKSGKDHIKRLYKAKIGVFDSSALKEGYVAKLPYIFTVVDYGSDCEVDFDETDLPSKEDLVTIVNLSTGEEMTYGQYRRMNK